MGTSVRKMYDAELLQRLGVAPVEGAVLGEEAHFVPKRGQHAHQGIY